MIGLLSKRNRTKAGRFRETAVRMGEGIAVVAVGEEDLIFSEHFACVDCGISLKKSTPGLFF